MNTSMQTTSGFLWSFLPALQTQASTRHGCATCISLAAGTRAISPSAPACSAVNTLAR